MRSFTHTIVVDVEVRFPFGSPEPGEFETAYPTLEIAYRYTPGGPAVTPRGEYGPIDPPDPAEVEFISARVVADDYLDLSVQSRVDDIAHDYLDSDDGYHHACDAATNGA